MPEDDALSLGAKLFAETIAAHGGDTFLALKSLKLTGRGQFTTPPQTGGLTVPLSSFTYYIADGGRSRLEARSPGGTIVFATRGNDRGGFVVLVGRTLELPADQTNGIEPIELLRTAATQGYAVTAVLDGTEEKAAEGKPLLPYTIHRSKGGTTHVFVEADTKLVRKMVTQTSRGEMTVLLSDYRSVSGLQLFGELQLLENGANVVKLQMAEFFVDAPVDNALFEQVAPVLKWFR